MKKCKVCKLNKKITEYYKQEGTKDGRFGSCKSCTKERVTRHRNENLERIQAYDRMRGYRTDRKEKVKEDRIKRTSTKTGREKDNAYKREHYRKNKEKKAANVLVHRAVQTGVLKKSKNCERCGKRKPANTIEGHHEDYLKPLDVIWLCTSCHGLRHREINEEKRKDK